MGRLAREYMQMGRQEGVQQGMQLGMQRGMQRGIHQGEFSLLNRQLSRRFGQLPGWALERLEQAECEQLEAWGERLLEAKTLEEVFH